MPPDKQNRSETARHADPAKRAPEGATRPREGVGGNAAALKQVRGLAYEQGRRHLSPTGGATDPLGMEVEPVDFKNPKGNDPRGLQVEPVDIRPSKDKNPRGLQVEPVDIRPSKDKDPRGLQVEPVDI